MSLTCLCCSYNILTIGLFDTESITTDTISSSQSLCVTCYFAPWTIENTTCTILIHILETSNKSSLNIHKNSSTGKGRECISKLPTDKEYIVNIAVVENQTIHVHPVNISINFTSSDSSSKSMCAHVNCITHCASYFQL